MNFVTTVGNTVMVFTPQLGQASRPATGRLKDNDYLSTIKHIQSVNFSKEIYLDHDYAFNCSSIHFNRYANACCTKIWRANHWNWGTFPRFSKTCHSTQFSTKVKNISLQGDQTSFNWFFLCRGQDNEVDLDGGFEQELGFEAQATKPLSVFTQDQSTKTRVASTTLRSNFIFVDGKVNS